MANTVIIEGSGRHIHVSRADLDVLFGEGFELDQKKMLSQPGQFASSCKVTVTGPKGSLSMSILGPCRNQTQVELSFTDARTLGLNCPVRESGVLAGFPRLHRHRPCRQRGDSRGLHHRQASHPPDPRGCREVRRCR